MVYIFVANDVFWILKMLTKRKIFFRADAGPEIGYGHYIRSLALADMLKQDFDCTMFTQTPTDYQLRESKDVCPVISLPNDDSKFDKFLEHLKGDEIVVLDNYFFTTDYQRAIKAKGCKLVCIDDMHDKHYVADAVINHCVDDKSLFDLESYSQLCLGAKYALLRAPFFETRNVVKSIPWLVCFGGSDPYNLTSKIVKVLQQKGVRDIVAIVGSAYAHYEELQNQDGVEVLCGLSAQEMADYFAQTENVVCSASTICYEALSQHCNVYCGWYVDNQYEFYTSLLDQKLIIPLGNLLRDEIDIVFRKIEKKINPLESVRKRINGLFIYLSSVYYNYIDLPDDLSRKVWECRNLPEIRECMTNTQPFNYASHCKFIEKLKEDKTKLYLAWFFNNEFVASFNLVDIIAQKSADRGLFVNPLFQAKCIAKFIEKQVEYIARNNYSIDTLTAEVLKNNNKSFRYHISNGYKIIMEDQKYYYFSKQI